MSTSERGLSDHLLVESFERLHKWLRKLGFADGEATRGALQMTFVLCGELPRREAREATADIIERLERPCTTD